VCYNLKKNTMKTSKIIIVFSFCLIVIGLLIFATCWTNETKSLLSQYAGIIVTGVGFIIAIYQLRLSTNQYFDDLKKKEKDYLDLIVESKTDENFHSIKTQVFNKSGKNKKIKYSFLLLTKQEDNIIEDIQSIIQHLNLDLQINCSNNFYQLKDFISKPLYIGNSIGFIPLEFYFKENIRISNENPCYTYSFDNNEIKLQKGIYSIRFFIYPKKGCHRSTVDSLIIKKN